MSPHSALMHEMGQRSIAANARRMASLAGRLTAPTPPSTPAVPKRLSCHVRHRHVAKSRQQVLLHHQAPMLLGRVFVHRQHRRVHSPAIVWNVTLDRLGVPSTILYLEGSLRVVAALASVRASAAAGMPPTPSTCSPHQSAAESAQTSAEQPLAHLSEPLA